MGRAFLELCARLFRDKRSFVCRDGEQVVVPVRNEGSCVEELRGKEKRSWDKGALGAIDIRQCP